MPLEELLNRPPLRRRGLRAAAGHQDCRCRIGKAHRLAQRAPFAERDSERSVEDIARRAGGRSLSLMIVRASGYRPKTAGGHYNTFLALEAADALRFAQMA